jgi:hypothetical protein
MKSQSLAGRIAVAGLAVIAVSCATASRQEWIKGGAGPDDLARDRYACMQESRVSYSGSYGGASVSPSGGSAGWGSNASTVTGGTNGGFIFLGSARRAQSQANRVFDACMEARGWR